MRRLIAAMTIPPLALLIPAIPAGAGACGWEAEWGGEHTHAAPAESGDGESGAREPEERILVGGGDPEFILAKPHAAIRPIQNCVDRSEVDWLADELQRDGKFRNDILVWVFTDGIWIMQGHHRYVASKLTGIPIYAIVERRFNGPAGNTFGGDDWSRVWWCNEDRPGDDEVSRDPIYEMWDRS